MLSSPANAANAAVQMLQQGMPASALGPVNPMMNPFPVLPSGSRWVMPYGNTLGSGILDGQSFTYYPRNYSPTWERRNSLGIQRELRGNHRLEVPYNGGCASLPMTRNLSPLAAQAEVMDGSFRIAEPGAAMAAGATTGWSLKAPQNPLKTKRLDAGADLPGVLRFELPSAMTKDLAETRAISLTFDIGKIDAKRTR